MNPAFFMLAACLATFPTGIRAEPEHYELVWAAEFDVAGQPDPANWTYEHGFVRNHELQWYQPDNAFVADGLLVIEGRRETRRNPRFDSSSEDWRASREFAEYTSSSVTTKGRHSWLYGRFEVRARIPTDGGLWPAVWFLGVEGNWPAKGEIDLLEYYDDQLLANAAWAKGAGPASEPAWDSTRTPVNSLGDGWADEFHTWRMEWDANSIALFVDHRLLNTIDVEMAVNPPGVAPTYPFRQPHYLLINLAIGARGGDPDRTEFPSRYEIDYVRVYQRANPSER